MSKIGPASQTSQQKLREVDAVVVIKPKKGGDKEMKVWFLKDLQYYKTTNMFILDSQDINRIQKISIAEGIEHLTDIL